MRLKRLIIKGFKSFADETVVNFGENLIGIVGPNGSGKSNIVDSIRWVLGEQKTKELRLDSMSDVIFNGSKERKEGKIAKVTLLFDNTKHVLPTEYNEVAISRVLYRNGTSEYLLNNVNCRKKDITNLFIDSGIGSNSYAIISLNMVEDILHDSGGSRRHMIEQAAGISKYKVRKKETLSKLRRTSEDLDRVQDILFEIQKNMSSFERQAKRTERYNRLKDDYKKLSIKISHIEVKELSQKHKDLKEKLDKEKDAKIKINSDIAKDEATLQQLKTDILESEKSLNEDQQEYNRLIERLGKIESDKNLTIQKLQNSKDRIVEIANNIRHLSDENQQSSSKLEAVNEEMNEMNAKLSEAEKAFDQVDLDYQEKSAEYSRLREMEKELKSVISNQQILKENLAREVESLNTRKNILEGDIVNAKGKIEDLKAQLQVSQKELDKHQIFIEKQKSKLKASEKSLEERNNSIENISQSITSKTKELNDLQVHRDGINQRISFLKNIIEKNEGLSEAIKYVIKHKKTRVTLFSDIIEIKEEAFTKIVELFLEPWFQYVLVDKRSEANDIYSMVRQGQKGKVHIAILDEIHPTVSSKSSGDLISLEEVISVDKRYRPFVSSIAGNVFISKKDWNDKSSLDSLDGKVILFPNDYLIASNGNLFGGSATLFEGVQLGRKQLFEKLNEEINAVESKMITCDKKLKEVQSFHESEKKKYTRDRLELSELRTRFDIDKSKLFGTKSRVENMMANLDEITGIVVQKSDEIEKVVADLENSTAEYERIKSQKIEDLDDRELARKIDEAHKLYLDARTNRDREQSILYDQRSQNSMKQKDHEMLQTSIQSVSTRIGQLNMEEKTQSELVKKYDSELVTIKDLLQKSYTEKEQLQKKLSSYEDTYYKEKGRIFELEKLTGENRNKLYNKDQLINGLNEQYVNIGFEIKGIHERNSIEFGIEINEAAFPEEYENENLDELKSKKDKIFDRIRSFGEINPMAITAYNEIKSRHDEISKERDDILAAKSSLEETIAEIEATASEKFNQSLADIRANFKEVFQSLFSDDDDCDIVLLDNEDPLEAKIEIIAKPKGKRPKSINLLSGGEKTLTAASFLFALYLLKPAPFCIFDEVDAPLDDVNILKFNKLIRNFSDDSQFIIITHNKLTMQEVDVLYGVYLKEQGVSGLSAVDFRTYDQTEMVAAEEV